MNIVKDKVYESAYNLLKFVSRDRRLSNELIARLKKERNMVVGAPAIALMQRPVTDLSVKELYWVVAATEGMEDIPTALRLTIKEIFTPSEIQKYSTSRFELQKEEIYPVVFDGLLKVEEDQWLGVLSTQQIFDLYKKQLINYNANTQRPLKRVTGRDGSVVYKINKNPTSVREIKEELLKGLFIPNCLTLNLNTNNPNLEFDANDTTIILNGGNVDLLDGFHRYSAIIEIMLEQPDFDVNFGVWFMNFSEEKANRYIYQEDKRNQISKQHIVANQVGGHIGYIAKAINEASDSPYYGEFVKYNKADIKVDKALITMNETVKCEPRSEAARIAASYVESMNDMCDLGVDLRGMTDYLTQLYFTGLWLIYTGEICPEVLAAKMAGTKRKASTVAAGLKYLRQREEA